jgi:hypothetical protein
MALHEADREDLLAEATALVERMELAVGGFGQPIVVGFRRDGCTSVYFGADPAYHFNKRNELRRAYLGGLLHKAEHGKLISLERQRTAAEVQLLRRDLTAAESQQVVSDMAERLRALDEALSADSFRVVGVVPADGNVLNRVQRWLAEIRSRPIAIAQSPRVG